MFKYRDKHCNTIYIFSAIAIAVLGVIDIVCNKNVCHYSFEQLHILGMVC